MRNSPREAVRIKSNIFDIFEANSSLYAAIVRIKLSSVNQASNKIHGIFTWHQWRRSFFLRRHLEPLKSRENAMYFIGCLIDRAQLDSHEGPQTVRK